jgi:hypothetical protein
LLVNGLDHSHHLASDQLVLLVFSWKIVAAILLNVTESARGAELNIDRLHPGDDLRARHALQHLDIDERLFGGAATSLTTTPATASPALRDDMTRDEKHHNCEYKNRACNPMGQLFHDPSLKPIILTRSELFSDTVGLCY